ncbi:hypothetical protein Mgra_00002422 [Meloidogyne graminicola]|uniref:Ubiquitin-like domain-containing protein n=1 Tax=Meloidogyne graminicola TaxID=189291 RepID=A0A8S9ZWS8_9BILA|nr:hypothetical protein Mgra_00002422 [Meloidogyne graminicola]
MADSGSDDETVKLIELKVKTIKDTYQITVRENSNIEKLKLQLSEKVNQPTGVICLIFSGRILKDHETLKEHKIVDGMVIHMVIKNTPTTASRESTPSSASSTSGLQTNTSTTAPGSTPNAGPFGGIGSILNNPMVRDMMNSPLMENLLSNPNMAEMVRNMLSENPQFQQIIQNNPDLGHILNDPRIIQQTLEMVQNPNMFNELMRNHDQAIRNIQGIPGGEAALHRMYQEVQEPLMNSVLGDTATGGQYASNNSERSGTQNGSQNASSRSQHAGIENAEALPNPWSRVVNQPTQQAGGVGGAATAGGGTATAPGGFPFSMMNTPGMQSLMRQILSNPSTFQNLINPENMQQFGQMLGNPAVAEQMRSLMSGSNPQLQQAVSNPRVFNALMQMHQAMQILHEECPQLFPSMFPAGMFQNLGGILSSVNQQNRPPTSEATATVRVTGGNATQPADAATSQNPAMPAGFAELLGSIAMMNMGNLRNPASVGAGFQQPPEERYRSQLEQLTAMALLASFGDINMAIERLLAGGSLPGGGDTSNNNEGNVERTD